ncbi:hypothetical protein FJTKL_06085 [Diaporthe vaccinii]|uniref:Uncharacterized protein n=1 Tax=Diaporthe vaccinii TaxID=105482 RepID=A0ABR4EXA9_9PEZI
MNPSARWQHPLDRDEFRVGEVDHHGQTSIIKEGSSPLSVVSFPSHHHHQHLSAAFSLSQTLTPLLFNL